MTYWVLPLWIPASRGPRSAERCMDAMHRVRRCDAGTLGNRGRAGDRGGRASRGTGPGSTTMSPSMNPLPAELQRPATATCATRWVRRMCGICSSSAARAQEDVLRPRGAIAPGTCAMGDGRRDRRLRPGHRYLPSAAHASDSDRRRCPRRRSCARTWRGAGRASVSPQYLRSVPGRRRAGPDRTAIDAGGDWRAMRSASRRNRCCVATSARWHAATAGTRSFRCAASPTQRCRARRGGYG